MNSHKELEAFAENAVAVNRLILGQLSISQAHAPPMISRHVSQELSADLFSLKIDPASDSSPTGMFSIGLDDEFETSSIDESPTNWAGLSPPGNSHLALRRSNSRQKTAIDAPTICARPPPRKVPSAMF